MTNRITRKRCVIVLASAALATVGFWLGSSRLRPTSAQILQDGSVHFVSTSVSGLALDQTLRVCVGTTDPRGPVVDWTVKLSDEVGSLLFQVPEQRSPEGQWRCANIQRSMVADPGDAGTGRVQVAMQVSVKAPRGTKSEEIVATAELVSAAGQTQAYLQIELENTLISSFSVSGSH